MTDHAASRRAAPPPPPTVAVLGTGLMGGGIAARLLRRGHPVRAWNRSRAKAEALPGATVCATPAEAAAGATALVTMLLDVPTVEAAVAGALPHLAPGALWLQTSTVGAGADRLRELAGDHGVTYVDAPVLGTPAMAADGRLAVLAAGPDDPTTRARVEALAGAFGTGVTWVGTGTEASRLKLAANSWVLAVTLAMAEALALTEASGLDPALFLDAIEGSPLGAGYARAKGAAVLAGDLAPTFSVRAALKDATLVTALAEATGAATLVARAVEEQYRRAVALGFVDADLSAVYHAARAQPPTAERP
jgi:3-hydroxyisobutyrate dehydrogenase